MLSYSPYYFQTEEREPREEEVTEKVDLSRYTHYINGVEVDEDGEPVKPKQDG